MIWKSFTIFFSISLGLTVLLSTWVYNKITSDLPSIEKGEDYKPLLVSPVYDRNGHKMGEFFKERRVLLPYNEIPNLVIQAFLAAEDDQFFKHQGINWMAIGRAVLANLRAGHKAQGASTITQQLVKTLFLSSEKTFERKFKELILAQRLEAKLSKEEILYLYLNQIFFGQNSYGIAVASETYFRKPVKDLNVAEIAILAGLPKAPSAYSPVRNPKRAKERQLYVLNRMAELNYIPKTMAEEAAQLPIKVYMRESFVPQAHSFVETVRLMLLKEMSDEDIKHNGYSIHTTIDLDQQIKAQKSVEKHLRDLDKRQGFRGELEKLASPEDRNNFLRKYREELIETHSPEKVILPIGEFEKLPDFYDNYKASQGLPPYLKLDSIYKAVVTSLNDNLGLAFVQVAELKGIIDIESARWARPFDTETRPTPINKFSQSLEVGDVIWVKLVSSEYMGHRLNKLKEKQKNITLPEKGLFAVYELEQEPLVEGAMLSIDHRNQEVMAMVGGYSFKRSQYNRALQAYRQTGSSYKAFIFAAALDRGYHPSSTLLDAPIVYENEGKKFEDEWKPTNHSKSYDGEITFRNALIRSLNVPAVKIIEDIGVPFSLDYSRRLQVFSKLNDDFTLALGSSSVTLYEMTRAFGIFAKLGKNLVPKVVREVKDQKGEVILSDLNLDLFFADTLRPQQEEFEKRRLAYLEKLQAEKAQEEQKPNMLPNESPSEALTETTETARPTRSIPIEPSIFFEDPNQLISPQTAFITTSLLQGVIKDPNGTAARVSGNYKFEVAGKTGSSTNYVDGWFIGYSPYYTTGVWVGFDQERSLGVSEVGGRTALPIWNEVMLSLHEQEKEPESIKFEVPEGIEWVEVDYETGELAKPGSRRVVSQAFRKEDLKNLEDSQIREQNVESTKEDLNE